MFRGSVKQIGHGDVSTLVPACGAACDSGAEDNKNNTPLNFSEVSFSTITTTM